eukprot:4008002-Pyramimonas_sp.AAC.1
MRTPPLGLPVELRMGPRNAVVGGGPACGHRHWGLRWSSLWGHETLYRVGETHADTAAGAFGGLLHGKRMRTPTLGPS